MSSRAACLGLLLSIASVLWAQNQGSVAGTVLDSQTGRPVAGVSITINGLGSGRQVTDSEGRFIVSLSPGTYTLRFSATSYAPVDITDLTVKAGESTEASTVLANLSVATSVDVVEKIGAVEATAQAMLEERRLAPTVSDSIGRSELASGTSSDAAGALEKVTGVSVVGDGFVYVRGLGERYSSTSLNGAMIPTTEPEKRVVPLDLFPTGMIENIKILKTYSPDLPAEFSGGMVQMQTVEFPTQRVLSINVKSGFNTATSFNRFLTYPGGSDYWGFGSGSRDIPAQIPSAYVSRRDFTPAQLQGFGRAFSDNWQPIADQSARPGVDWSAAAGGTFGRLGIIGAFSFSNKPQLQSELLRYVRQGAGSPALFTDYPDYREYTETAKIGAVFNAAYRLSPSHKIIFRNTFTHESEKAAREFSGWDQGDPDFKLSAQRLRYIERGLIATGVEGDHSFANLRNSLIHWQFTYSKSTRDEPDLREAVRLILPDGRAIFRNSGLSGIRFFSNLDDHIYEPQLDYSIPFIKGAVSGLFKTGFRATVRRRDFGARRFLFGVQDPSSVNLFLPTNQLLVPANIRPNGFELTEQTRGTDKYSAEMNVYAGYAMVDLSLGRRWRIEGGIRFEDSEQTVTSFDNRVPNAVPVTALLQNTDPTPGVNAIYAISGKQNLRISYSRTVSRPDFRELSPFDFNNTLGGFVTQGNPALQRARIQNFDARWEWFSGGNQLIAASVFGKLFDSPIEQTIIPSNDLRQSFVNADGARNVGFELEFRRSLTFVSRRLNEFSVSSNFTFVDSKIDIKPQDALIVTSKSRPLLGQSRYIGNGILEWKHPKWRSDARFYANYVSRRITDVGTFQVPDIYQEPNVFLDAVYQYSFGEKGRVALRFEAENLADNEYLWTQGRYSIPGSSQFDDVQRRYQLGRTFQLGVNFAIF